MKDIKLLVVGLLELVQTHVPTFHHTLKIRESISTKNKFEMLLLIM